MQDFYTIIAIISGIFSVWRYCSDKKIVLRWKEFEVYHSMVKQLVDCPDGEKMKIDRQCAVIFELQYFERYYPHTLRMLKGLKKTWCSSSEQNERICNEIDIGISYLEEKQNKCRFNKH